MAGIPINLIIALTAVFGLCIGSFLNVLVWRLPREEGIGGRSRCPGCKSPLPWAQLLPIASYAMQRGRCRSCGKPISPRYPIIEAATAILFALAAWQSVSGGEIDYLFLAKALVVISLCVAIFIIDLEHYLILDSLVLPGMGAMILLNLALDFAAGAPVTGWGSATVSGIIGGFAAAAPFWLLWAVSKGKWMGFGDVKYAGFMGLALGVPVIATSLFLAFMLGTAVSVVLLWTGRKELTSRVPFGTFLTIATVIGLFWGREIWDWYASLAGLR